jgi:hypothetical protein
MTSVGLAMTPGHAAMTPGNPGLSMTSVTSTLNTSLSSLFSSTQLETIGNYTLLAFVSYGSGYDIFLKADTDVFAVLNQLGFVKFWY